VISKDAKEKALILNPNLHMYAERSDRPSETQAALRVLDEHDNVIAWNWGIEGSPESEDPIWQEALDYLNEKEAQKTEFRSLVRESLGRE